MKSSSPSAAPAARSKGITTFDHESCMLPDKYNIILESDSFEQSQADGLVRRGDTNKLRHRYNNGVRLSISSSVEVLNQHLDRPTHL